MKSYKKKLEIYKIKTQFFLNKIKTSLQRYFYNKKLSLKTKIDSSSKTLSVKNFKRRWLKSRKA